jgi:hypothetical protein
MPGRFDEAMRIAVVRRYPRCPASIRALALSLVMLGLIDSVALAPLALAAVIFPSAGSAVTAGLAVVAAGGVGAAAAIVLLPRAASTRWAGRFRIGRWLNPRTSTLRSASEAWTLVSACWLLRALAVFLVLGTVALGFSLPLALLFLCAGAAAAAVPFSPAGGTATQIGAGATALTAAGAGTTSAIAAAVSIAALGVFSGAAVLLLATASGGAAALGRRRRTRRNGAAVTSPLADRTSPNDRPGTGRSYARWRHSRRQEMDDDLPIDTTAAACVVPAGCVVLV